MTPSPLPPVVAEPQFKRLKYSLTRWDILRWQSYLMVRNRVLIGFGLVVSLALAWNDLRTPELAANSAGFKVFYAAFLTVGMFCVVGLMTMVLMSLMVVFKKYRGLLGEHELEIRDDGLVERTDVNESLHRWAGFHKIARSRRHLYVYVTDNNVHIVPRRGFGSEQEEEAFRSELERRVAAARRGGRQE